MDDLENVLQENGWPYLDEAHYHLLRLVEREKRQIEEIWTKPSPK